MVRFLLKKLASSAVVLALVSMLTALFLDLMPGDAAATILGQSATPASVAALREQLGLDRPLVERYSDWVVAAVHGDLGTSLFNRLPVTDSIISRIPVTASLALASLFVTIVLGLIIGVVASLRPGSAIDRTVSAISGVGAAIPHFWLALMLVSQLALARRIFPATGFTSFSTSPGEWARGLVLPVTAMAFGAIAVLARQTRSAMVGVMCRDYVRAAIGRGVPYRTVILKHALKNALVPIVTTIGLIASTIIGASVFIESVFGMSGVGRLLIVSVQMRDLPMVQGVIIFVAIGVLIVNFLVDISYGWLNPKARVAS